MTRIGLLLPEPRAGGDPLGELTATLGRAAADGFSSAWMSNVFGVDALTALAVAGRSVPDIALGTGVVPTYPRHPAALAQQALTAQAAVGGRLTLGIGLSHQPVIEGMFGYSFDNPLRHMREYLEVLLPLLQDRSASFSGETVRAQVALSTPCEHRVPVLLAALAPRMLRLAGSRTDGTVTWMTGPATIRVHVAPLLSEAAVEAGRPAPRVACALPVCVTDDVAAARERANTIFAVYGYLPSYRAMLDREGASGPGDVAIAGDEASVAAQIEAVFEAGATEFIAAEFGSRDELARTRALLASVARQPVGDRA